MDLISFLSGRIPSAGEMRREREPEGVVTAGALLLFFVISLIAAPLMRAATGLPAAHGLEQWLVALQAAAYAGGTLLSLWVILRLALVGRTERDGSFQLVHWLGRASFYALLMALVTFAATLDGVRDLGDFVLRHAYVPAFFLMLVSGRWAGLASRLWQGAIETTITLAAALAGAAVADRVATLLG